VDPIRRCCNTTRLIALIVAALVICGLQAATPDGAVAQVSYLHGGITDCETCHVNAHTWWTPTNEHCLDCHPGFQVRDRGLLCWTCHAPGQDMDAAREEAACTASCHVPGGSTSRHAAHPDRPSACLSCHPVSASAEDPAGSAHHTVPAPALTGFAPGAGLPGTQVTLTGVSFTDATAVSFNGAWAAFAVESDTRITAIVPSGASSGTISVISRGGKASSAEAFIVTVVPALTLKAAPSVQTLGRRVRLGGVLAPVSLAGARVSLTVQQRRGGIWETLRTVARGTSEAGAFGWSYAPPRRGTYRVAAWLAASPAATAVRTAWVGFRVR
jgi:hypothetical protein